MKLLILMMLSGPVYADDDNGAIDAGIAASNGMHDANPSAGEDDD